MARRFAKEWKDNSLKRTFSEHLRRTFRPSGTLNLRLNMAVRRLEMQIKKLGEANKSFSERDKSIFAKIVKAYTEHDMARANVFAMELVELRKMRKTIMQARLALEQLVLRLRTVSELGNIVATLGPAVKVLGAVEDGMANILPEADKEFGQIGGILSGMMVEAGRSAGMDIDFDTVNEESQQILEKAGAVAEQRIKRELPEWPVEIQPSRRLKKSKGNTS